MSAERTSDTPTSSRARVGWEQRLRACPQALILLAAYLFSGGGADVVERVRAAVSDEPRQAAAVVVAEGIVRAEDEHAVRLVEARRRLLESLARPDAGPDELRAVLQQAAASAERLQDELLEARFALRDQLTEDEWRAVFETPSD